MELGQNPRDPEIPEGRPYRSHLQPACLSCRKRKSRCKTSDLSSKCLMCQAHATPCVFPRNEGKLRSKNRRSPVNAAPQRMRTSEFTSTNHEPLGLPAAWNGSHQEGSAADLAKRPYSNPAHRAESTSDLMGLLGEAAEDSSHIVSPAVADDNEVLQSYLSTFPDSRSRLLSRKIQNSTSHLGPLRRVMFDTIPKRPLGVLASQPVASQKLEIIEKFLEPYCADVINL
jgi:hypothetical protein